MSTFCKPHKMKQNCLCHTWLDVEIKLDPDTSLQWEVLKHINRDATTVGQKMQPANRQKKRPANQFWSGEQHDIHRKLDRTCKDWIEFSDRRLKSVTDLTLSSSSLLFQDTSCLLLETLIKFRKKRVGVGEMDMQVIIIMFISQYHYRRSDDLWLKVLFWEASQS